MGYYGLLYGVLTIVGGIIGYLQAGSAVSLIAGGVAGLLLILSALQLLKGRAVGYYGQLALSLILAVFFGIRFLEAYKFMPAGLMVLLSVISIVGLLASRRKLLPSA